MTDISIGNNVTAIGFLAFTNRYDQYPADNPLIAVIEDGEKRITAEYSGEERETYLKRLAGVKTTALDMLYLNYYDYHPNGNEVNMGSVRDRFVSTARYADIDCAREHYSLDRYVAFIESEVRIPD